MPVLHLGVIDIPHQNLERPPARTAKEARKQRRADVRAALGKSETISTGEIATILEDHYHVMEVFFEDHATEIADIIGEQMGVVFEDILSGAPPTGNSMVSATGQIGDLFKRFIDRKEMDGVQPGVPTLASLKGINHRFLHPYAKVNPVRPSFKDTGQTYDAFWAEIEF